MSATLAVEKACEAVATAAVAVDCAVDAVETPVLHDTCGTMSAVYILKTVSA